MRVKGTTAEIWVGQAHRSEWMCTQVSKVKVVFGEFETSRNRSRLDIDSSFPKGFRRQVYAVNPRHLQGWHVGASIGYTSHAKKLDASRKYQGIDIEIRETTSLRRATLNE